MGERSMSPAQWWTSGRPAAEGCGLDRPQGDDNRPFHHGLVDANHFQAHLGNSNHAEGAMSTTPQQNSAKKDKSTDLFHHGFCSNSVRIKSVAKDFMIIFAPFVTYLRVLKVAKPFSTGSGVPVPSVVSFPPAIIVAEVNRGDLPKFSII